MQPGTTLRGRRQISAMNDDLEELMGLLQSIINKKLVVDPESVVEDVLAVISKLEVDEESELFPIMILIIDYLVAKGIDVRFDTEDFLNEIIH